MTRLLNRLFPHKHHFKQVGAVMNASRVNPSSAIATTCYVFRCSCGEERREITPAGYQRLEWGEDINYVKGMVA